MAAAEVPRFCSTAAGLALAGAESCLAGTLTNPAAWDGSPNRSVQFGYAMPFGLKELAEHHFFLSWQGLTQKWDAAITHTGFSQYQETAFRVSCSRRIWHSAHGGLSVVYNQFTILRYGQASSCWLDGHLYWPLLQGAAFAIVVQHLEQNSLTNHRPPLALTWRAGLKLNPYRILTVFTDLYKESPYPADVRLGMEWQYHAGLCLRLGSSMAPWRCAFGFGITQKQVRVDYGCSLHADLGWTHQASIRLFF
jgi:hypothetical protein